MEDFIKLFIELRGVFGGALAIGISVAVWLWSNRGAQAMANANRAGQLEALGVYEQLLKTEREARAQSDSRADQFAKERNEALQQVWQMKGQMEAMAAQLERQNTELSALRDQVRALKEKINARS